MLTYNKVIRKSKEEKSRIRGFWKYENKIYYDYIEEKKVFWSVDALNDTLPGEKAVFVKAIFSANVINTLNGEAVTLNNKELYFIPYERKAELKSYIKVLLQVYGGLTVYQEKAGYKIEIWH